MKIGPLINWQKHCDSGLEEIRSVNQMTEISKMIETDAMTEREISPHSVCTTRNKRMAQASHLACIVTRQSTSPLTAPMLLIWLKDGRFCFERGCASIAPAPTKLKIVAVKWYVRNVT